MPLTVTRRQESGSLTITGYVAGRRIRRRATSDNPKLAAEEARLLEAELLREQYLGPRRGAKTFAHAAAQYILSVAPRPATIRRLDRLTAAIGAKALAQIDQEEVNRLARTLLGQRKPPAPATIVREITTPVRAVLNYSVEQGWCDPKRFRLPRQPHGRTAYLLPHEAEALVAAAAPHLATLLIFLLSTGARMSEALELDWNDVRLAEGACTFWNTKAGAAAGELRERHALLPPRAVAALANIPYEHQGAVFRWPLRRGGAIHWRAYEDKGRDAGGQTKSGWKAAVRRAGLTGKNLTPHGLRHTWATWHYALHRDLLRLQFDGGWSTIKLVTRYAHLLPEGHRTAIAAFWAIPEDTTITETFAAAVK